MSKIDQLKAVDYTTLEFNHGATMSYGSRIGFVDPKDKALLKTNPRNEIGEFGIRCHGFFGCLFYSTIQVEVQFAKSLEKRVVHLNKKNTVSWLNSQLPKTEQVNESMPSEQIIKKINGLSSILKNEQVAKDKIDQAADMRTYTADLTNRPLYRLIDRIRCVFWQAFAYTTHTSWRLLKFRFALQIPEKVIERGSEILAINTYFAALEKVPAYKKFISDNSKEKITRFRDVPPTSKDNYIKPALHSGEDISLYVGGKIPSDHKRDTSTGTSGKSTPFYRGKKEQEHVQRMTNYAAKAVLGDRPYAFINGFAMGPWATGVTAALGMFNNPQAGLSVIGPDIDEIFDCIKEYGRLFGKDYPIVVSGYPDHIRRVIEKGIKEGYPFHEYNIIGVVGGEGMSEVQRDLLVVQKGEKGNITRTGFKQCYSSYGASDLDINIGYESDFEIELRKLCHNPEHAALAEELFGKGEFKPMIFHYDPLNYHIESDERHQLYYTCVRGDRISPRVRYNLGDVGKTMPISDLLATLKKHGVELNHKPNTSLPLLFIWGRQGAQISFNGCKIAPENLGETIRLLNDTEMPGLSDQVPHFGMYQHEENGRKVTEILLEFKNDEDYQKADSEFLEKLLNKLAIANSDFGVQLKACGVDEKPVLRVFKKGESPMYIQQMKYTMKKKQYIFAAGDEFIPTHQDIAGKGKLIRLTK